MALTKEIQTDLVSIDYDNFERIAIVEHTIVNEDGAYLVGDRHKRYIYPGHVSNNTYIINDVSDEHEAVQALAALWEWDTTHTKYAQHLGIET